MTVRTIRLGVAALGVLCLGAPSLAQTADELVARNLDARGGAEKLRAVQAMKLTGTLTAGGMTFPVTILAARPNLTRQETRVEGQTVIQAFDGERAWVVNPMAGSAEPQEIPGPPAQRTKMQGDFDGPLVDYRQKGHRIELVGPDTVQGVAAMQLRLTRKDGVVQQIWLDATTGLEVKSAAEIVQGGQTIRIETLPSDYRTVNGLKVPFVIQTIVNGQPQSSIKLEAVDLAPKVDPSVFRMPVR